LLPGSYRFRVIGAGSEGVWNETGASFAFQVAPVYWRTGSFRLAMLALAALIGAGVHRLRVRQLTRRFNLGLEARISERTQVARELHDTMLQTVQASKLVADYALRNASNHDQMVRSMGQLSAWLERATAEARAVVNSLRTTNAGHHLPDSLRKSIEEAREWGQLEIALNVIGDPREVNTLVNDEITSIVSESVRNACAHSRGSRVVVSVAYNHALTVQVIDDGTGIDPAVAERGRDGHFGLRGMKERASRAGGKLTIAGGPGAGTVVTLVIPGRVAFSKPLRFFQSPRWR
jgi:signal transduction histidine kinase